MTLTKEQRDGLRTLERAATEAPWFPCDFTEVSEAPSVRDISVSCDSPAYLGVASMENALTASLEEARSNAAFIAEARNLVPALLDDLDAALAENERLQALVAHFVDVAFYSDSYGVRGSDFCTCHYCGAGGAPGASLEHRVFCPVRQAQSGADTWWAERAAELEELESERARTNRAESEVTALRAKLEEAREVASVAIDVMKPFGDGRLTEIQPSARMSLALATSLVERFVASLDQTPAVSAGETV